LHHSLEAEDQNISVFFVVNLTVFSSGSTVMSQETERLYLLAFTQAQIPSISFSMAHAYFRISFLCNVILTQYCAGDKIEKNEMGWACGAYG